MAVKNDLLQKKTVRDLLRKVFSPNGSRLKATVGALLLMLVVQALVIVFAVNGGSAAGLGGKMLNAWTNILRNNVYTGVIAIGMCLVIETAGIDISVGSQTCAIGAVIMYLIEPSTGLLASWGIIGVPAYIITIPAALIVGFILGEINGLLVANGRIPAFIVTLGTMKIYRSVTQQLTQQFNPSVPSGFKQIASFRIGGQVLLPIFYWLFVMLVIFIISEYTSFGKGVLSVGSSEKAARYFGYNTVAIKRAVYAISGVMCAIAAIIYVSRIGSMDFANAGSGFEMDAIAGVAVGGTSMAGGKGNVFGAFLGVLIIGMINSTLNMLGVPTFLCDAVRGGIIIAAVLIQRRGGTES